MSSKNNVEKPLELSPDNIEVLESGLEQQENTYESPEQMTARVVAELTEAKKTAEKGYSDIETAGGSAEQLAQAEHAGQLFRDQLKQAAEKTDSQFMSPEDAQALLNGDPVSPELPKNDNVTVDAAESSPEKKSFAEYREFLTGMHDARKEMISAEKKSPKEFELAKEKYEAIRAEYVSEKMHRNLNERKRDATDRAEAFQTEKGWGRKFYENYKQLGKWNAEWAIKKVLGEDSLEGLQSTDEDSRLKKAAKFATRGALKMASVRTAVSAGLLVGGMAAGAGAATGAGLLGMRKLMSSVGSGFGGYDLMKMGAELKDKGQDLRLWKFHMKFDKDKAKRRDVTEGELAEMTEDDIITRLDHFDVAAELNGIDVKENPTYSLLRQEINKRAREGRMEQSASGMNETKADVRVAEQKRERRRKTVGAAMGIFMGSKAALAAEELQGQDMTGGVSNETVLKDLNQETINGYHSIGITNNEMVRFNELVTADAISNEQVSELEAMLADNPTNRLEIYNQLVAAGKLTQEQLPETVELPQSINTQEEYDVVYKAAHSETLDEKAKESAQIQLNAYARANPAAAMLYEGKHSTTEILEPELEPEPTPEPMGELPITESDIALYGKYGVNGEENIKAFKIFENKDTLTAEDAEALNTLLAGNAYRDDIFGKFVTDGKLESGLIPEVAAEPTIELPTSANTQEEFNVLKATANNESLPDSVRQEAEKTLALSASANHVQALLFDKEYNAAAGNSGPQEQAASRIESTPLETPKFIVPEQESKLSEEEIAALKNNPDITNEVAKRDTTTESSPVSPLSKKKFILPNKEEVPENDLAELGKTPPVYNEPLVTVPPSDQNIDMNLDSEATEIPVTDLNAKDTLPENSDIIQTHEIDTSKANANIEPIGVKPDNPTSELPKWINPNIENYSPDEKEAIEQAINNIEDKGDSQVTPDEHIGSGKIILDTEAQNSNIEPPGWQDPNTINPSEENASAIKAAVDKLEAQDSAPSVNISPETIGKGGSIWGATHALIEKNADALGFGGGDYQAALANGDTKLSYEAWINQKTNELVMTLDQEEGTNNIKDLVHEGDKVSIKIEADGTKTLEFNADSNIEAGYLSDENVTGSDEFKWRNHQMAGDMFKEAKEVWSELGDKGIDIELTDGRHIQVFDWDRNGKANVIRPDGIAVEMTSAEYQQYMHEMGVTTVAPLEVVSNAPEVASVEMAVPQAVAEDIEASNAGDAKASERLFNVAAGEHGHAYVQNSEFKGALVTMLNKKIIENINQPGPALDGAVRNLAEVYGLNTGKGESLAYIRLLEMEANDKPLNETLLAKGIFSTVNGGPRINHELFQQDVEDFASDAYSKNLPPRSGEWVPRVAKLWNVHHNEAGDAVVGHSRSISANPDQDPGAVVLVRQAANDKFEVTGFMGSSETKTLSQSELEEMMGEESAVENKTPKAVPETTPETSTVTIAGEEYEIANTLSEKARNEAIAYLEGYAAHIQYLESYVENNPDIDDRVKLKLLEGIEGDKGMYASRLEHVKQGNGFNFERLADGPPTSIAEEKASQISQAKEYIENRLAYFKNLEHVEVDNSTMVNVDGGEIGVKYAKASKEWIAEHDNVNFAKKPDGSIVLEVTNTSTNKVSEFSFNQNKPGENGAVEVLTFGELDDSLYLNIHEYSDKGIDSSGYYSISPEGEVEDLNAEETTTPKSKPEAPEEVAQPEQVEANTVNGAKEAFEGDAPFNKKMEALRNVIPDKAEEPTKVGDYFFRREGDKVFYVIPLSEGAKELELKSNEMIEDIIKANEQVAEVAVGPFVQGQTIEWGIETEKPIPNLVVLGEKNGAIEVKLGTGNIELKPVSGSPGVYNYTQPGSSDVRGTFTIKDGKITDYKFNEAQ